MREKKTLCKCIIGGLALAAVLYFDIYISVPPIYRLVISVLQAAIIVSLGYLFLTKIGNKNED